MFQLFKTVLDLFDGAAAGGEGGAEGTTPAAGKETVLYGKQPDAEAPAQAENPKPETTQETPEDRRKRWRDMIKGEFADLYAEDTQRMISRRYKPAKEAEERAAKQQPILDMLAQRYGVTDGDVEKIAKALDEDNAYWQEAADSKGMSVEQYRAYARLEQQNMALVQAEERRKGEAAAQATLAKWEAEEAELKQKLPGFDLRTEAENPEFLSLLRAGTPMEHAYRVIHFDELMGGAVQATAAATEQRVVSNIRAKGQRPTEAGLGAQGGVVVKNDVHKLNKADRAAIARRVERGEKITF